MKRNFLLFLLFTAVRISAAFAQTPVLVKDLNPGAADAFDEFNYRGIQLGDLYLFPASDDANGQELYSLNNGQISLLKDINPGAAGSGPTGFALLNGKVYFSANDGAHGTELWSSDGTPDGTQLVFDLETGANSSNPQGLITDQTGNLYFSANGKCFTTDGTGDPVALVGGPSDADLSPEEQHASVRACRYEDGIAFILLTGSKVIEIWKAKGDTAVKLYSAQALSYFAHLYGLASVTGGLIFTIEDSFYDDLDGTYLVDPVMGSATRIVNATGNESNLARRVFSLNAEKAILMNSKGFFATDGTAPVQLTATVPQLYQAQELPHVIDNGKMLFLSAEPLFSVAVSLTDGTPTGTSLVVTPDEAFMSPVIAAQGYAYFAAGTSNLFVPQIWKTNLSTGISTKLFNYVSGSQAGPSVLPLTIQGKYLFYISNMGGAGRELYRLDAGISSGIAEISQPSAPYNLHSAGAPGSFRLDTPDVPETVRIRCFGVAGLLLDERDVQTGSTFTLPYPAGFYILQLSGKQGEGVLRVFVP